MVTVKFEAVNKDFRYEIATTDTGDMYLVDMGFPIISWFLWVVNYILPKRCYPISIEAAKMLPTQKRPDAVSPSLVGGIGVLFSSFVLHTDDVFSVSWSSSTKIGVLMIMVTGVVLWRFYHLARARESAIKAGVVINSNTLQLIRFQPIEIKLIILVIAIMSVMYGCLVTLIFLFLSQPSIFS